MHWTMPLTVRCQRQDCSLGQQAAAMLCRIQLDAAELIPRYAGDAVMFRQSAIEHGPVGIQELAQAKILREHFVEEGPGLVEHARFEVVVVSGIEQLVRRK